METVREKMIHLMDCSISIVEQVSKKENIKPEEIVVLPALLDSIVNITAHAVIEKKD